MVFNTILCVPHIGILPTLMAMILGNLIMGYIIDHFGWFGIPVALFTWKCFLGVLLVLLGLLIAFKRWFLLISFASSYLCPLLLFFLLPKREATRNASNGLSRSLRVVKWGLPPYRLPISQKSWENERRGCEGGKKTTLLQKGSFSPLPHIT